MASTSKQHEAHPDCPDTLDCLPDADERPQHTLPVILRCAILGSPRKCLTIREIYAAMEDKYPYYKTAGPTWKQSVRHHLSLNRLFERQPRPVTDPGFGSYWTVNLTAPPGTKRPRKRGRPNKDIHENTGPPPVKRRGRLLKQGGDEEKDDDGHISEEEFESEEDMVYPFEQHSSVTTSGSDNVIDRLQIEMAGLRRQSAEAMSTSLRVSDQLAEAQAEASRAKAALRIAESMLQDEARKRREAERATDEEAKMRRAAEETLRQREIQWSVSVRSS